MNVETVFFALMSTAWVFLVGWLLLLIVASGIAFREVTRLSSSRVRSSKYHSAFRPIKDRLDSELRILGDSRG